MSRAEIIIPDGVRDPEKYFNRTVQTWHRTTFPKNWPAIDIDLVGFCYRCYRTVYLIEASEVMVDKPTLVLEKLAEPSDIPVLLIQHHLGSVMQGRLIKPVRRELPDREALELVIAQIRNRHARLSHPPRTQHP